MAKINWKVYNNENKILESIFGLRKRRIVAK
jgi:hypothetical protein